MKKNIHPKYFKITAFCSCGNVVNINSTINHNLNLEICSNCHPFYTGKQRVVNTGGRIEKFKKRCKLYKNIL